MQSTPKRVLFFVRNRRNMSGYNPDVIDGGGMSKYYLDAMDKTMPIVNRRNAKKKETHICK